MVLTNVGIGIAAGNRPGCVLPGAGTPSGTGDGNGNGNGNGKAICWRSWPLDDALPPLSGIVDVTPSPRLSCPRISWPDTGGSDPSMLPRADWLAAEYSSSAPIRSIRRPRPRAQTQGFPPARCLRSWACKQRQDGQAGIDKGRWGAGFQRDHPSRQMGRGGPAHGLVALQQRQQ
eukprot:347180-Chlamydomonas_euryale.AAC.2